jgi:hypothetical protein
VTILKPLFQDLLNPTAKLNRLQAFFFGSLELFLKTDNTEYTQPPKCCQAKNDENTLKRFNEICLAF